MDLDPSGFNLLGSALTELYGQAQPRPDLGTGRVATYAGRVVRPGEGIAGILARQPSESPDAEGMGGISAILAGAPMAVRTLGTKVFREAADAAPVVREVGGKFFRELSPADLVKQSYNQLKELKAGGDRLNLMSVPSNRGGRAGLILPDGQVVFGSSHGDLIKQYGKRFGQNQRAIQGNLVMDVDTSAGRHLLSTSQLDDLYR